MSGTITDLPVRVCRSCGATYMEDANMYEDPARCPHCGAYPGAGDTDEGDDEAYDV